MSTPEPRDVIAGFFADIDAGRAEEAFARLSADIVYRVVAPPPYGGDMDVAGLIRTASTVFERLATPLKLHLLQLVVDGEQVVAEVRSDAPTKLGGRYDNEYLFLYRVVDGKIVEAKEYLDSAKYIALMENRL